VSYCSFLDILFVLCYIIKYVSIIINIEKCLNADDFEWEDIIIYTTKEEAIEASLKYPWARLEIFKKREGPSGYQPTYNYYEHGDYVGK
jgi:hypothetical protein